jgi:hypothetical protein
MNEPEVDDLLEKAFQSLDAAESLAWFQIYQI